MLRDSNERKLIFSVINKKLLPPKEFLEKMHATIMSNNDFLNFGEYKIIMLNVISNTNNSEGIVNQMVHSFHINVLIKNNSTFDDYWNQIKDNLTNPMTHPEPYGGTIFKRFELLVWNVDHLKNQNIKIHNSSKIVFPNFNRNNTIINKNGLLLKQNGIFKRQIGFQKKYNQKNGYHYKEKFNGFLNSRIANNYNYLKLQSNYIFNMSNNSIGLNIYRMYSSNVVLLPNDKNIQNRKYKNYITPLKKVNLIKRQQINPKPFYTLDIETIEIVKFNNIQIPVIITIATSNNNFKLFQINHNLLKTSIESIDCKIEDINKLLVELWSDVFNYIINSNYSRTIFVHNLGSFDGYFIYKGLLNVIEDISCLNPTTFAFTNRQKLMKWINL